jgi:type I restriction enzyme, R subunit
MSSPGEHDYLAAEARARKKIDAKLHEAGWVVQDRAQANLWAGQGVALREFIHAHGHGRSDYGLYVDRQLVGVLEAKPDGTTLTEVERQTRKYIEGVPDAIPAPVTPLPFGYEATGTESRFTCFMDPEPRSRRMFGGYIHRPETLAKWLARIVSIPDAPTVRAGIRSMPPLNIESLWDAQVEAIRNTEESLRMDRPRALIQMATGSGKTYTAAMLAYRLIEYADAARILFLVDRRNLGRQAKGEFQRFDIPGSSRKFAEVYNIQHLTGPRIDKVSRVCISTVQRMYSILRGRDLDEEIDARSLYELQAPPEPITYNANVPPETFDFIVVDECHRSIFGVWRQVLEYFDDFIIGLSATPNQQALGFFEQNLVMEYPHDRAVTDKVNVDYEVYRIQTQITAKGSKIEAGLLAGYRARATREMRYEVAEDDIPYTEKDLDRSVVAKGQIRTIIRTFRDRLFTEIFPPAQGEPPRTTVPKTLIFAKDDSHAEDIVDIVRTEFGKGNDFCQKITYRSVKDSDELIAEFRNSPELRIAVTVDQIATGTDIKPLECLLFMRDVRSRGYYEQMLGRGVRVINNVDFRAVTPDATAKEHFIVVDAVGVTERDRFEDRTQPLDRKPTVALKALLDLAAQGSTDPDLAATLASRLARLDRRLTAADRSRLAEVAHGLELAVITHGLLEASDPDCQRERAIIATGRAEPTPAKVSAATKELVSRALQPLAANPDLRNMILDLRKSYEQTIDETSVDVVQFAGYSEAGRERARAMVKSFRDFIDEHRDEIHALQVLYSAPYAERLTYRDVKELAEALSRPPRNWTTDRLWAAYDQLDRDKVRGSGERVLTDVISLVRYALDQDDQLVPFPDRVEARFEGWLAMQEQTGTTFTEEQQRWLGWMKDHIATSMGIDSDALDLPPFTEYGGIGHAYSLFGDQLPELMQQLSQELAVA